MIDPEAPYREYGLHVGFVKNDVDPQKQGRVEVVVPGLLDGGSWAEVTMMGSPQNRGNFIVPVIETQVIVGFLGGDLHQPVVLGSCAPPVVEGSARAVIKEEELPKFIFHENKDWIFVLGETGTDFPYAAIFSREEENRMGIIMDLDSHSIKITGPESITLETNGVLHLVGEVIRMTVGGTERVIQRNGQPI
jgi:hypothetical protein